MSFLGRCIVGGDPATPCVSKSLRWGLSGGLLAIRGRIFPSGWFGNVPGAAVAAMRWVPWNLRGLHLPFGERGLRRVAQELGDGGLDGLGGLAVGLPLVA